MTSRVTRRLLPLALVALAILRIEPGGAGAGWR